jgi:hypothetical protein
MTLRQKKQYQSQRSTAGGQASALTGTDDSHSVMHVNFNSFSERNR